MKELKDLARKLRNAIAVENMTYDLAFEGEEINEKYAAEWEEISDMTVKAREALAAEIVKVTAGQIDEPTAYRMTFKPELFEIIRKIA